MKILIAVDGTKHSQEVISTFYNLVSVPDEVVILNVEDPGSGSLMYDMLSDAEMSTFKESIKDTDYKADMDARAEKILSFYRANLSTGGRTSVNCIVAEGNPTDEILRTADEQSVDMIILGNSGRKGLDRLIAGSVTRNVQKQAKVPVLIAKKLLLCEEPYTWKDAYQAVFYCSAIVVTMMIIGFIIQERSLWP